MPRGRLTRTKVREEKKLVKARLQAIKEWEERTSNFSYNLKKHVLKITEKLSFDDWLAMGVGAWAVATFKKPEAFLWGAIGYKLARTDGGTPPVAQISGLATLAVLGLAGGGVDMLTTFIEDVGGQAEDVIRSMGEQYDSEFAEYWDETKGRVPYGFWKRQQSDPDSIYYNPPEKNNQEG